MPGVTCDGNNCKPGYGTHWIANEAARFTPIPGRTWPLAKAPMADFEAQARISVAMCTYNGERYLREQLDTIAAQTRPPCELIVCDDRSQDRTLEILEAFAHTAAFPVRIHQNPEQLGSTRNFDQAIRLCEGEYIALSDQDDRWRPQKLARLGSMLDQDPGAGVVFSDAALIDENSTLTGRSLWEDFRFSPSLRKLFMSEPGRVLLRRDVVTGATLVFRRSLLARFEKIPPSWVHDGWIVWMCVLWMRLLFTPEQLTEYRLHSAQQLGAGGPSRSIRVPSIRNAERARYTRVAQQFEDLFSYIQQFSPTLAAQWNVSLEKKITFLHARANAPRGRGARFLFLMQHTHSYFHLARGWRSISKDCLLGSPETR